MKRYYVGLREGRRFVFNSPETPTVATHGSRYSSVIGPFRTKRAAILTAVTGGVNPHIRTVADAERIARSATAPRPVWEDNG
jgi:hypothetical protein